MCWSRNKSYPVPQNGKILSDIVKKCKDCIGQAEYCIQNNYYEKTLAHLCTFDSMFYHVRQSPQLLSSTDKQTISDLRYRYGTIISIIVGYERSIGLPIRECYIPNYYFLFDEWSDNHIIDDIHRQYRAMLDNAFSKIKESEELKSHELLEEVWKQIASMEKVKSNFDGLEIGRFAGILFRYDADNEKY